MGYRGPRKHMKRLNAPKGWLLDKLSGVWAPKPSPGPHKETKCIPMILVIRNRLKYALTGAEVQMICMDRQLKVDGKIRTDKNYPLGFMDVLSIDKANANYRILYDIKGRFVAVKLRDKRNEKSYKLCKVIKKFKGLNGIPFITTHDGRTIAYPDPSISINDTIQFNFKTNKIERSFKFEHDMQCIITGGRNKGRVGTLTYHEKHAGSPNIVHLKDINGSKFLTRQENVFVVGDKGKCAITLPKRNGIKVGILEERDRRIAAAQKTE